MLSTILIFLITLYVKEYSCKSVATFTAAKSGATGTVTIENGKMTVALTAIDKTKWQNCPAATTVKFHIHEKWVDNGSETEGAGDVCGSAKTGGHIDPWLGCGSASQYSAQCSSCLSKGTGYECSKTAAGYPFRCEVGDSTGLSGQASFPITNNAISATVESPFMPVGKELNGDYSIVFHCLPKPDSPAIDRIFCGKLVYSEQAETRPEQTGDNKQLTADFASIGATAKWTLKTNGDITWDMSSLTSATAFTDACPGSGSEKFTIWEANDGKTETYGDKDSCGTILKNQWDPTAQYFGELTSTAKDPKTCTPTGITYSCSFDAPLGCSPSDISQMSMAGASTKFTFTALKATPKGEAKARKIAPLSSLKGKWLVWHCDKKNAEPKVVYRACAKLQGPPTSTPTSDSDSAARVSISFAIVTLLLSLLLL